MADCRVITVTLHTAVDRVLEVERLAPGAHVRARRLGRYPAGKGVNVSRALATLGIASIATGFVGRDEKDWFEADLGRGGLIMPRLLAVDGPTRENITLLARDAKSPAKSPANFPADLHVREDGFDVTRQQVQCLIELLDQTAGRDDVVVFSGSLPPGMSPDDLLACVATLARRGIRVALDTGGTTLRHVLRHTADAGTRMWLIKPNATELAECLDTTAAANPAAVANQAMRLMTQADWIAATAGREGAALAGQGGMWIGCVTDMPQTAVNTVGCGDCFLAGLLAGLLTGLLTGLEADAPRHALRQALAVAAANTAAPGAADFDPALAAALKQQTQVRPYDPSHDVKNTRE
jgi:1-phosphofructokinase